MRKPANNRAHLINTLSPVLDLMASDTAVTLSQSRSMETSKQALVALLSETTDEGFDVIPSYLDAPRWLDRPSKIRKYGTDAVAAIDQLLSFPDQYGVILEES